MGKYLCGEHGKSGYKIMIIVSLQIWRFVSHVEISTWCSRFFRSKTIILYIRRNFSAITIFAILALLF